MSLFYNQQLEASSFTIKCACNWRLLQTSILCNKSIFAPKEKYIPQPWEHGCQLSDMLTMVIMLCVHFVRLSLTLWTQGSVRVCNDDSISESENESVINDYELIWWKWRCFFVNTWKNGWGTATTPAVKQQWIIREMYLKSRIQVILEPTVRVMVTLQSSDLSG